MAEAVAHGDGPRELSQVPFYFLKKRNGTTFVQHRITDETFELPAGGAWLLGNDNGKVYAFDSRARGDDSIWMASKMRTVLWQMGDRVLIQLKATDQDSEESLWLDTLSRKRQVDVASFKIPGLIPENKLDIKIYLFDLARSGARVFWELEGCKDAIGHGRVDTAKYMGSSFRRTWWPWLTRAHRLDEEHKIPGSNALKSSDEPFEVFVVSKTSISTVSLLLLLVYWRKHLTEAPAANAVLLWNALLEIVPYDCDFAVPLNLDDIRNGGIGEWTQCTVQNKTLLPSDTMKELFGAELPSNSWPSTPIPLNQIIRVVGAASDAKAAALVHGLASVIEVTLSKRKVDAMNLLKLRNNDRFHVIDPDLKAVAVSLGRNPFRAHKFAKAFKLRLMGNAHRELGGDRVRYYLGARLGFCHFTTVATSIDGTRFSKKDYQCGPCLNVETGRAAWLPPTASDTYV